METSQEIPADARPGGAGAAPFGLQDYITGVESILDRHPSTPVTVREVDALTRRLVADDAWLAPEQRAPVADSYARYLLHRDRHNRFVVLSLVWSPGQATPIHDHGCWGVMGILEGTLQEISYERLDDGSRADWCELEERRGVLVARGSTGYVLPPYQEIHSIGNAGDATAVSIHIYGRDIDEVSVFDPVTHKVSQMRIKYYNTDCDTSEFII